MARILIANATIFDATGTVPFAGDVLVEGNRIAAVKRSGSDSAWAADRVIDAHARFLMPGMTEGHAHLSFENVTATENLIRPSAAAQAFATARGAKALIDAGFTSAYGASEAKMGLGVAVRDEVNAGRLPGPRIRAAGLEISVTGAMGDESHDHNPRIGPSLIVDGPQEIRKAVRLCAREGVDNIKLDVSGDPFYPGTPAASTPMGFDEIAMAVETAHAYGKKINAHTRSIAGSKACVRAGVDGLFHCEFADEKLFDLMEEARDRIFVVPTVDVFHQMVSGGASPWGITPEVAGAMGIPALLAASIATHTELRKRGVRHLIGGDYGFAWSAHGTQARDLRRFIDYYGYSPADALICATRHGGSAMRDEGDLGTIAAGQLADLVLVDGDVIANVDLLTEPANIALVMKDGAIHSEHLQHHRILERLES